MEMDLTERSSASESGPVSESGEKPKRLRRWVRRAGLAVVLLVLFVIGLIVNAAVQTSRQRTPELTIEELEVDAERVAETLAEFITVPSISYPDRSKMDRDAFLKLHELLREKFPRAHETMEVDAVNELSLLYRWEGRDRGAEPVLLMSHLDVVPVEEESKSEWLAPVDRGTIKDGYVWGRGALDVKCGVIAIMSAIETLLEQGFQPERTVYLAFGHDEEVGGQDGNGAIAKQFADSGIRLACVLDEGGAILNDILPGCPHPIAFVGLAEKRHSNLTLVAYGEGGHGSMPGRSAILNLAEAIHKIDQNPMPIRITSATEKMFDFLGPELPLVERTLLGNRWLFRGVIGRMFTKSPTTNAVVRTTVNFTQLNTDSAENQSASVAKATINARLLPGDTLEDLSQHLVDATESIRLADGNRAIQVQTGVDHKGQDVATDDSDAFGWLQMSIHEVFPDVIVAAGLTTVSTDSSWYYGVTDNVYRFIPMRMESEDVIRVHGVNERIKVDNLGEISQFYMQFLRKIDVSD